MTDEDLVKAIAGQVRAKLPPGSDASDLEAVGTRAAAAARASPPADSPFAAYLRREIKGAMLDLLGLRAMLPGLLKNGGQRR